MKELLAEYRHHLGDTKFMVSTLFSFVLFSLSIFANLYAGIYATQSASNSVTDIVLSNVPIFDVNDLFVYGTIAFLIFTTVLLALHPRCFPFVFFTLTMFFTSRAIFVSLTHIGPFSAPIPNDFGHFINKFFFGDDFFFSGHTGSPFLFAFIFWHQVRLRYIFLVCSVFFAGVVLLGHLHYSIDVLSAFFIAYAIYHMALRFFPEEHTLFVEGAKTM